MKCVVLSSVELYNFWYMKLSMVFCLCVVGCLFWPLGHCWAQGLPQIAGAALAVIDSDADGDADLFASGYDSLGAYIEGYFKNNGGAYSQQALQSGLGRVADAAWVDLDNDNDPDLVLIGWLSGSRCETRIFENQSGALSAIGGGGFMGICNGRIAVGDYDGNGYKDIALSGFAGGDGPRAIVIWNNGGFAFSSTGGSFPAGDMQMCSGDFNGDGKADLAVGAGSMGVFDGIKVYFGQSNRSFIEWFVNQSRGAVFHLACADSDGDNDDDLWVMGLGFSEIGVFVNLGNGTSYVADSTSLPAVYKGEIVFADWDNDTDMDGVCFGGLFPNSGLHIFEKQGTTFTLNQSFAFTHSVRLAFGDEDGDGDLDLFCSGRNGSGVLFQVLYNATGVFQP